MNGWWFVPSACVTWLVVFTIVLSRGPGAAVIVLVAATLIAWVLHAIRHAIVLFVTAGGGGILAFWRVHLADTHAIAYRHAATVMATVSGRAQRINDTVWLMKVSSADFPGQISVLYRTNPGDLARPPAAGSVISGAVRIMRNKYPGVSPVTIVADGTDTALTVVQNPAGLARWTQWIIDRFNEACAAHLSGAARGLVPGMVLGDTTLMDEKQKADYLATGLTHLCAVSGSNVSIIVAAAYLVASLFTQSKKIRALAGALALIVFVFLIGPEPSVLRAAVMGLVGVVAVASGRRHHAIGALAVSIVVLVYWDSGLAVNLGFALSVAATAGIVLLSPHFSQRLAATTKWPELVTRAVAVTVAATVVTWPIIALMSHQLSLVTIVANLLAAPSVAPVTILGLVACLVSLLPGPLSSIPLFLAWPFAWWIRQVAHFCAHIPGAHITVPDGWLGIAVALSLALWVAVVVHDGFASRVFLLAAMSTVGVILIGGATRQEPLPVDSFSTVTISSFTPDYQPPPGTDVIIVTGYAGKKATHPTVTADGIPVVFPLRDGPVQFFPDGSIHAASGAF